MNDYTVLPLCDNGLIGVIQAHVRGLVPDGSWHATVRDIQDKLNKLDLARAIAEDLTPRLEEIVGSSHLMVQSNLYLRAARPQKEYDVIGWHRESMYGCQPEAWNVWLPIEGVTAENCLRYVPGSAEIPDEELSFRQDEAGAVERGSDGHKIGLLYAPKRIIGGVDLTSAKPLVLPLGWAAVFPGSLIHGAAQNRSNRVRYSVDFRVIGREHIGKQKKSFAGDGQDFFVPLKAA